MFSSAIVSDGPALSGKAIITAIQQILNSNPIAKIEGIGHTHIAESFETSSRDGKLFQANKNRLIGLSEEDYDSAEQLAEETKNPNIEVYAVEIDNRVYSTKNQKSYVSK